MNYGWIVLGIITLFEGLSGFGRTSALSPFLEDLCHDLDLSNSQISGAYSLANLLAGFVLPYIGQAYDRYRPSNFLRIYVLLFSGALIGLSMLKFMQFGSFINFTIFLLGFCCIRTAVHAYSVIGRSTTAVWFDKKRGLATALSCFLLSSIASLMPWLNYKLHLRYEWYQVWVVVGIICGIIMLSLCSFVKKPDHPISNTTIKTKTNVSTTKNDFFKKPIFWLLIIALGFKNFQNTGIAFYLIPMGKEFGAHLETIALSMIFISIINTLMTFIFGHFFERIGPKKILLLFLIFDCCFLLCFKGVSSLLLMLGFVVFSGFYWALNQIVIYLVIPKIFGTKSIGKIHGYVTTFACLGSASGPFFIGLIKDFSSFQVAISICAICAFCLLCSAFIIKIPTTTIEQS